MTLFCQAISEPDYWIVIPFLTSEYWKWNKKVIYFPLLMLMHNFPCVWSLFFEGDVPIKLVFGMQWQIYSTSIPLDFLSRTSCSHSWQELSCHNHHYLLSFFYWRHSLGFLPPPPPTCLKETPLLAVNFGRCRCILSSSFSVQCNEFCFS
jgi:hypothetical protein